MFDRLPTDCLRLITRSLDALSLTRLESVSKDVRDLHTGNLSVVLTRKRIVRGAQQWLDANMHRVHALVCLRGYVDIPCKGAADTLHRLVIKYVPVPPSVFRTYRRCASLRHLDIVLDRGMTEHARDVLLHCLPCLETLDIAFAHTYTHSIRMVAVKTLKTLRVRAPTTRITMITFPPNLETLVLDARDGISCWNPLPPTVKRATFRSAVCRVTLPQLFRGPQYPNMESLVVDVPGMPELMRVTGKCPRLQHMKCITNVVWVSNELFYSPCLASLDMRAMSTFVVGFVSAAAVRSLKQLRHLKAHVGQDGAFFDFKEFFRTLEEEEEEGEA